MEFLDLEPQDERLLSDALPVLLELRPHLTGETLAEIYAEGHPQGLRFTAVYEQGRCLAVAGWRLVATTVAVRKLYVDDLVTTSQERGRGVGRALIGELERRAREAGCQVLDLDSGTARTEAHHFYFREGMRITSFHFVRTLD